MVLQSRAARSCGQNYTCPTPVSADKWFCHSTSVFSHYVIYNTTDIWKHYEYFICSWGLDSYKYVYCDGRLAFTDCSLLWLIYTGAPRTIRSEALTYGSLVKCAMAISLRTFQFIHFYFAYYSAVPTSQQFSTWYKLVSIQNFSGVLLLDKLITYFLFDKRRKSISFCH